MIPSRLRLAVSAALAAALALAWTAPIRGAPAAAEPSKGIMAEGGNADNFDMAPETRLEVVEAAAAALPPIAGGPIQPTWDSVRAHYKVPQWLVEAKFGLFMHWGLYSVPAHHNEWYEKHMYAGGADTAWHIANYGPLDTFGYKDFIPLFTADKFDPDAWAELFRKSGARYVIPTAQHHDGFALWDSAVTPFNAARMGPKRDLIGQLARAVRARGLKFGVSNHEIEAFQFINAPPSIADPLRAAQADLFDPRWAGFYHFADRSDEACRRFLTDWYARTVELIDRYQPDILWFDNGVDIRYLDPLKLRVAAYYYNRAQSWGKEVTISTKKAAFAPSGRNTEQVGSVVDFEKIGVRSPSGIRPGVWQVDEPIGSTWGYTTGMSTAPPGSIVRRLVDTVSKNGNLLLNLSPRPDGTIPEEQQATLLEIGRWLGVNGEAIYGTHAWTTFGEASAGTSRNSSLEVRFTVKGPDLYAVLLGAWPDHEVVIQALSSALPHGGTVRRVGMLGSSDSLPFTVDAAGLHVTLPPRPPCSYAYVLRIAGLEMNAPLATLSGNPR